PAEKVAVAGDHAEQPVFVQPSELPPLETPMDGPITGYDVRAEDIPTADSDAADQQPKPPPPPPPSAEELALWDTTQRRVKEPARPSDASLLRFLGESKTSSAWFILAAGLMLLGLFIHALRELRPM